MPSGKTKKELADIGKATRFTSENQPANPGRPKKLPELDALMAEVLGDEKSDMTAALAILKKWREMAAKGNLKAGEMLFDRAYGKPKQGHEHTGKDGAAIEVKNWIIEIPAEQPAASYDPDKTSM